MSDAQPSEAGGAGRWSAHGGLLGFSRLDWMVAWRHLRTGDARPSWVLPLLLGAVYLIAVGGGLALYASSLDAGVGPVVAGAYDVPGTDMGPTALQRFYGAFGGLTLMVGLMFLLFGLLAWFFNLLPTIITMSVLLGCMALVVVLSLMSGLEGDLRDKILAQKAHVRVTRPDGRPFEDYLGLADALAAGDGLAGASPYLEGEIMVRSGLNRQGAILGGIMPERQVTVSNLPDLVPEDRGSYDYLIHPDQIPDADPLGLDDDTPWRLRHLDGARKPRPGRPGRSFEAQSGGKGKGKSRPNKPTKLDLGTPRNDGGGDGDDGDDGEDQEDDGGWEDPSEILGGLRGDGADTPAPTPKPAPLGDAGGLLTRLPKPAGAPVGVDALEEEEGWEDPVEELEKLRDEGVVPAAPEPGPDEPEPEPAQGDDGSQLTVEGADDAEVVFPLLIGKELSSELGVGLGAQVQLITPIGRMTPAGRVPGQLVTKVAGVFFSGMYEYDRKNVYAPLDVVQRFLLVGDRVTGIEIKLVDVDNIDAGKAEVERIVAAAGRSDELLVEDWRDLNRNLFSAMFLEKVAMFIALLFVVLVASFGILASNLMSVMEKAKEIAILKAMGTADGGIKRIFIAEGLCLGLLGSFGGIGMGLGLCAALDRYGLPLNENVYYIDKLPVVVNPAEVALVGAAALIIVCFSSLYPAQVASRLRPVDGLRQSD